MHRARARACTSQERPDARRDLQLPIQHLRELRGDRQITLNLTPTHKAT